MKWYQCDLTVLGNFAIEFDEQGCWVRYGGGERKLVAPPVDILQGLGIDENTTVATDIQASGSAGGGATPSSADGAIWFHPVVPIGETHSHIGCPHCRQR